MKIKYSKAALKFLAGVQKKVADSIREAINGLTLTPPEGDIKDTMTDGYALELANTALFTAMTLTTN